ncbi:hypothetical protein TCAL_14347 [Tigriopus californicus]|uniref:UMA domain-containing protein n=1 Tax=Tigriopus californicus TaxID=6832 RepID=A0A553NAQ3_TIGCA|nr:hypothetical protein TCAL_14347 [Tigriopus californicus]
MVDMVSRFFGKGSKKTSSVPGTPLATPGSTVEETAHAEDDGFTLLGPQTPYSPPSSSSDNPTPAEFNGYPLLPNSYDASPALRTEDLGGASSDHPLHRVPFKLAEQYSLDPAGSHRSRDQTLNDMQKAVDRAQQLLTSINHDFQLERSVLSQSDSLSNQFGLMGI